jgi:hypothetical protein
MFAFRLACSVIVFAVSTNSGYYDSVVMLNASTGSNVALSCTVTRGDSVSWLYIRMNTTQQSKVYGDRQVLNRFAGKIIDATDRANGNYSLILSDAQTEDSGWYVCISETVTSRTERNVASKVIIGVNVSSKFQ